MIECRGTLCRIVILSVLFWYHYLLRAYELFFWEESGGSQGRLGGILWWSLGLATLHRLALVVVCHDRDQVFCGGRRQSQISFVLIK